MEVRELLPAVLTIVLIGMIIGVGIIVNDKFRDSTKTTASISYENASGDQTGAVYQTERNNVTGVSWYGNQTINTGSNASTAVGTCVNFTSGGRINVCDVFGNGANQTVSYSYISETLTTSVMSQMTDTLATIPKTWMPLIITIIALAVVLTLVIGSFAFNRR